MTVSCPMCLDSDVHRLDDDWRCRSCHRRFDHPRTIESATPAAAGNVKALLDPALWAAAPDVPALDGAIATLSAGEARERLAAVERAISVLVEAAVSIDANLDESWGVWQ